jgi:hypothetical protein
MAQAEPQDAFDDLLAAFDAQESARRERLFEHWFREHKNHRRRQQGLEPLPPLEYNDLDRENDIHLLTVTLPGMRAGPGWKGKEAAAILDYWEEQALENLRSYGKERA